MVIDSSTIINVLFENESRIKKAEDSQKIKPVDNAGGGREPELNISKDKVTEKRPDLRRFDTGDIYKQNGDIKNEDTLDHNPGIKTKSIDIVI